MNFTPLHLASLKFSLKIRFKLTFQTEKWLWKQITLNSILMSWNKFIQKKSLHDFIESFSNRCKDYWEETCWLLAWWLRCCLTQATQVAPCSMVVCYRCVKSCGQTGAQHRMWTIIPTEFFSQRQKHTDNMGNLGTLIWHWPPWKPRLHLVFSNSWEIKYRLKILQSKCFSVLTINRTTCTSLLRGFVIIVETERKVEGWLVVNIFKDK